MSFVEVSTKRNGESAVAAKMKIEVWSDIMCPFCYIGEKKLDDALAGFADAERIDVDATGKISGLF